MENKNVMPRSVIKYPGAKWSIAQWIISVMPPHKSYLEPFFGSGAGGKRTECLWCNFDPQISSLFFTGD